MENKVWLFYENVKVIFFIGFGFLILNSMNLKRLY